MDIVLKYIVPALVVIGGFFLILKLNGTEFQNKNMKMHLRRALKSNGKYNLEDIDGLIRERERKIKDFKHNKSSISWEDLTEGLELMKEIREDLKSK